MDQELKPQLVGPLEMQIQHTQLYALLHIGGGGGDGGDVVIGSARLPYYAGAKLALSWRGARAS